MTKKIPDGYGTVTPYLVTKDAARVIEFLQKSFDAKLTHETMMKGDKIGHAEIKIGTSIMMISDECEQAKAMPSMFYIYTEDCDAMYKRAITNGAKSIEEPSDKFYGDRSGGVIDMAGNMWYVATHKEDLSDAELKKRAEEFHKQMAGAKK